MKSRGGVCFGSLQAERACENRLRSTSRSRPIVSKLLPVPPSLRPRYRLFNHTTGPNPLVCLLKCSIRPTIMIATDLSRSTPTTAAAQWLGRQNALLKVVQLPANGLARCAPHFAAQPQRQPCTLHSLSPP